MPGNCSEDSVSLTSPCYILHNYISIRTQQAVQLGTPGVLLISKIKSIHYNHVSQAVNSHLPTLPHPNPHCNSPTLAVVLLAVAAVEVVVVVGAVAVPSP